MADTVKKTDIDSYYTRLNNIRSKFGLSTVSEPETIQNQTPVLSKDIKSFDQSMTDTANSRSQYITKDLSTGNLDPGYPTMSQTDLNIY